MKKFWVGTVILSGLFVGIGLVYAHIIPGVDKPYNSSAYYSATAISYADSPSAFFYRDLTSGGNIVYDPERHQRSILSCMKYDEILKTVQDLLKKKQEDKMPFGNDGIRIGLQNAQEQTASLNLGQSIIDKAKKVFINEKSSEEEYNSRTRDKQLQFLNDVYRDVANNAQKSIQNSLERQKLLEEALQRAAVAKGSMQAEQAKADIEALLREEIAERNMIWNNFAAMDTVTQQYKLEKELRDARNVMEARTQFSFSDPYHLDAYEKRNYEKPEPLGLPNF